MAKTEIGKPSPEQELDFRPETEAEIAHDGSEPTANRGGEIIWRWGTAADIPALRLIRFRTEVASGRPMYLPEFICDERVIAVAERDGKIIGAAVAEDSVLVTLLGTDAEIAESAGKVIIPKILTRAREERTRLVE